MHPVATWYRLFKFRLWAFKKELVHTVLPEGKWSELHAYLSPTILLYIQTHPYL